MSKKKVTSQGNTITIHRLNYYAVGQFYDNIRSLVYTQGLKNVFVKIAPNISLYPNQILPIIGVIEYYRSQGVSVEFKNLASGYVGLVTQRIFNGVWNTRSGLEVLPLTGCF